MSRAEVDALAVCDIAEIAEFIGETRKNPPAARNLIDEFARKCEIYARQPEMGDLRDDLEEGLRSFTFRTWYVAVYEPLDDGINVLRVFDGRSEYGRHFAG